MMVVKDGNDIDIELLKGKPTLFYERLCYFLGKEDADRVLDEIAQICNYCWDADTGCRCWNDE